MSKDPATPNLGDVSEIILAAAIAARFRKRLLSKDLKKFPVGKPIPLGDLPVINSDDIKDVLRVMVKKGGNDFDFKASFRKYDTNRLTKLKSKVFDNIEVTAAIPEPSARYISNEQNWNGIQDLFLSAVKKVNNDRNITKRAIFTEFNLQKDKIVVSGEGTKDQKGTKVDIRLDLFTEAGQMRPRKTTQISLKYDVGQFAQAVGLEFKQFGKVFGDLGLEWESYEEKFLEAIGGSEQTLLEKRYRDREGARDSAEVKALKRSVKNMFKTHILPQLKTKLTNEQFKSRLALYAKEKATKNESGLELVSFTKGGGVKQQDFGLRFVNAITKNDWEAAYIENESEQKAEDPTIIIYQALSDFSKKQYRLLQFRYRFDAIRQKQGYKLQMRTYVEAGGLLYTI